MSDEQLDKERRRGWRWWLKFPREQAELLHPATRDVYEEVGEISPEAWAALGTAHKPHAEPK